MSQDLFAAFGDFDTPARAQPDVQVAQTPANNPPQPTVQSHIIEDDDDFGDFEDAATKPPQESIVVPRKHDLPHRPQPTTNIQKQVHAPPRLPFSPKPDNVGKPAPSTGRHPFADHMDILFSADDDEYNAGQDEWNDLSNNPEAAMAYSKRVIQQQLDAEQRVRERPATKATTSKVPIAKVAHTRLDTPIKPQDSEVLFDAEVDTPEDDDWGNFEEVGAAEVVTSIVKQKMPAPVDLLGLEQPLPPSTMHTPAKPHSRQPSRTKNSPLPPLPINDDPWDDFHTMSPQAVHGGGDSISASEANVKAASLTMPPTNIPPPSMILTLLAMQLKQGAAPHTVPSLIKESWVAAHVLAGRKLRWKRSSSLAASMRIGPAAAGGKSGMKLAGVDRGEVAKEDREVAELLSIWRSSLGKLRTALASHNATLATHSAPLQRLPELSEAMPIKALKPVDGGFYAPHECALCGLKREERIVRVDDNIDDSFGEWWTDNASMHTTCAQWWTAHELELRSR